MKRKVTLPVKGQNPDDVLAWAAERGFSIDRINEAVAYNDAMLAKVAGIKVETT